MHAKKRIKLVESNSTSITNPAQVPRAQTRHLFNTALCRPKSGNAKRLFNKYIKVEVSSHLTVFISLPCLLADVLFLKDEQMRLKTEEIRVVL